MSISSILTSQISDPSTKNGKLNNTTMKIEPFPGILKKHERFGKMVYVLTPPQLKWLRKYYPTTANGTLSNEMNCQFATVSRLALQHGIRKNEQYFTKRQDNDNEIERRTEKRLTMGDHHGSSAE